MSSRGPALEQLVVPTLSGAGGHTWGWEMLSDPQQGGDFLRLGGVPGVCQAAAVSGPQSPCKSTPTSATSGGSPQTRESPAEPTGAAPSR